MYQRTKASIKANVLCFWTAEQQRCGVTGRFWRSGNELWQRFRSVKCTFTFSLRRKASKGAFRQFGEWHWYRSYLRQKATEAADSDLGLLRLWAPFFTPCTMGASGHRICFFFPCLHPLHILYQCVVNRWFFGVSFGGLRGSVPMLPTDTNTLDAICVHQAMLDSLQSTFVRMWLIWCEQNLV